MLPQLAVFEAVSRLGSYTRAAEELFLAQPTVSLQMKKLAEALGVPLLQQAGKRVLLTDAGRELAGACKDIFARLAHVENRLTGLRGLDHGRLRIAVSGESKYFMPGLLSGFCDRHPSIEVSMHIDNWRGMRQRIQDSADDLYVLTTLPPEPELCAYPLLPNPIAIYASAAHPLAAERSIAASRLAAVPFILREPGSASRRLADEWLERHAIMARVRMELGSNEAIKQAVLAGSGIAFLSRYLAELDGPDTGLRALDVEGFPIMQQWFIAHPAGRCLSKVASAFLDYARANADNTVTSLH
jgi:DNA-binding transcriptional LysR family regulator